MRQAGKYRPYGFLFIVLIALLVTGCTAPTAIEPTEAPLPTEQETAQPAATVPPAAGYVRVTAGNDSRWFTLPEEEEYAITVKQHDPSGGEHVNVVRFTPRGALMESSTCDNQDCVSQGEVTLENKETRVLSNWVICLPNQVSIELYTADELAAMSEAQQ